MKSYGARRVYVVFAHAVLSGDAIDRMADLPVNQYVTTDTIPIPKEKAEKLSGRLQVLSTASLIGEVIRRTNEGRSVGEMFNE